MNDKKYQSTLLNMIEECNNITDKKLKIFERMIKDEEFALLNYGEFDFYLVEHLTSMILKNRELTQEEKEFFQSFEYKINDIVYNNAQSYIEKLVGIKLDNSKYNCYPKSYFRCNNHYIYLENKKIELNYLSEIERCKKTIEIYEKEIDKYSLIEDDIWKWILDEKRMIKKIGNIVHYLLNKKFLLEMFNLYLEGTKKELEYSKTVVKEYKKRIEDLKKEREEIKIIYQPLIELGFTFVEED